MSHLKHLIHEIHRRSLWQVLLIYCGAALVAYQAVQALTEGLGLPQWFPALAIVLFIVGLPVVLATAFVREGEVPSPAPADPEPRVVEADAAAVQHEAGRRRRFVTWRNAAATFVVALAVWGVVATGWMLFGGRPARPQIGSLAVLPLENLSRDSAEEYFADGMTEALITRLSQIGSLEVKSRTSAMQYKGAAKQMAEIAEELGVEALVEGSVLRVEDRVRITAQLIHGPTDRHLWADSYERDLRDVLALLSEVAQAIAGEIEAVLTLDERARLSRTREVEPEVQEACLKGRYHLARFTVDGAYRAIEYFEEAIESDPTYAEPYAGLATAWYLLGQPLGAVSTREGMPKAKAAAEKALSLDPDLADAYLVLGHVSFVYDWDWQKAERQLQRAIELDPSYPMAHHVYGVYLAAVGRYEEGIVEGIRAVELEPLSLLHRTGLAEFYNAARQYDRALEEAREVLDMNPYYDRAREVMMWAYERLGMCEEYLALRREQLMRSGAEPEALARQAALERACADSGFESVWRWEVERSLERIAAGEYVRPSRLANVYAGLGQVDEAFEWLERAYAERDGSLAFIKTNPAYDGLRSDPRFQDLLRRMNIPE
jgi:TolB-like protein/Tfp pilus assembly protein PilF